MITLVLGGARSGKSEFAEELAASLAQPVTYIATARPGDDADFLERIEAHRLRRPPAWKTVEAGGALVDALAAADGTVLIDSLGPWVAGSADLRPDGAGLCTALRARVADTVVVSEEVGLAVHPSTEVGRRFRDAMGLVNRAVSGLADEAVLVIAGRPLRLPPPAGVPGG